jgi:ABC-type maltose transport system permease subunit
LIRPKFFVAVTDEEKKQLWKTICVQLYRTYKNLDKMRVVINGDGTAWIRQGTGHFANAIYQIMPYAKPALATAAVLVFQAAWNNTYGPMTLLRSEVMKTLPVAISTVTTSNVGIARLGAANAASAIMVVPPIAVSLFMQADVLKTFVHSGIKG